MVSRVKFNTKIVKRPIATYEEVEVEDTPSIVFEGDDVGHLLYVLYRFESGVVDGNGDVIFLGGHLSDRIKKQLGDKLWDSLVADFEARTGAAPIWQHQK